ncbi:MAG: cytidine deaminase [candidate division WOR-3 bacterium]|nr:MAG: cytidine deaminase [candidate division WOR-3 bacterium]
MAKISSNRAVSKKISSELIRRVQRVLKNAYAPYSNLSVGAALYCANGNIYTGCNVENSSYSVTMCAERIALYKAISEGERNFLLLLLYSPAVDRILPCGACLQVYAELAPDILITTMNAKKEFCFYPLHTLISKPFRLKR